MKLVKRLLPICLAIFWGSLSISQTVAANQVFKAEHQQPLAETTVKAFKVGDQAITIQTPAHWYAYVYVNNNLVTQAVKTIERPCVHHVEDGCVSNSYLYSGYRTGYNGSYTVKLPKALEASDTIKVSFSNDDNFYYGDLIYTIPKVEVSQAITTISNPTEEAGQESQIIPTEETYQLYKTYLDYEARKSWQHKVSDFFGHQWANLKSWWQDMKS
ncbi:TPA: hypothetical protein TVQ98_001265 [Streptococcus equi subsp. zooepidemicus]|nr:hypothetical protein [Streptococcus equi subsp. zooepidemicus]HEL0712843.1 hypothetical protein [Streptococcus equi subsp. zooepidemicus]HEL0737362.1 hypothetical protein [Streptococcus equi subsp. zooepidemicus]HEL0767834.1 hypothetical protein [Streptococcus equi subsp. zooepidemicus]HEL1302442.1 hypothetical protein [Streptococcus equi subsp. zooepidemicus]